MIMIMLNVTLLYLQEILLLMIVVYQVMMVYCDQDQLLEMVIMERREIRKSEPGTPGEQGIQGPPGPLSGGALYTRWGRTTCPGTPGTELVHCIFWFSW